MSKSATSFVFLVVLAATITAAFSVYAANAAGNTHAQDWASRIEAAFGRAPSCAEQVWPAIDAKCLVTVDGRALNQPVRNAI
ncbi:MAG: hypothetical protein KDJ67_12375 [Nitratireductor sp.]|nr:hypothetical protein [Nitratireductor sp.]